MKKVFQLVLFYSLGIACVFALSWRVNDIDSNNNKTLVDNTNVKYTCNN